MRGDTGVDRKEVGERGAVKRFIAPAGRSCSERISSAVYSEASGRAQLPPVTLSQVYL